MANGLECILVAEAAGVVKDGPDQMLKALGFVVILEGLIVSEIGRNHGDASRPNLSPTGVCQSLQR